MEGCKQRGEETGVGGKEEQDEEEEKEKRREKEGVWRKGDRRGEEENRCLNG